MSGSKLTLGKFSDLTHARRIVVQLQPGRPRDYARQRSKALGAAFSRHSKELEAEGCLSLDFLLHLSIRLVRCLAQSTTPSPTRTMSEWLRAPLTARSLADVACSPQRGHRRRRVRSQWLAASALVLT